MVARWKPAPDTRNSGARKTRERKGFQDKPLKGILGETGELIYPPGRVSHEREQNMECNLDMESLIVKCPHCGRVFEEKVARQKYYPALSCPLCRKYMGIDALKLQAILESSLKTMDDLFKRLLVHDK